MPPDARDGHHGAMERVDCIVIGGGVIGLAVARRLAIAGIETLVLEREAFHGLHTSSRNSEVVHAGLYYAPGSLKARLCVRGREQLYRYCEERAVAHRRCGKLVVATSDEERPRLQHYYDTAACNGVPDLAWLTPAEVASLEPAVRCVAALWSPSTGIVSSHELMQALLGDLEAHGGTVACRAEVIGARLGGGAHRVAVQQDGTGSELMARMLVNAAGLEAQSVAHSFDGLPAAMIPARRLAKGHYFTLQGRAPFHHLVYPVAGGGGLGIHVTLDLAGAVRFGPDVEWVASVDYSVDERRRDAFATAIRRYYPDLDHTRLQPGYTGIRPKLAGPGEPAADFCIQGTDEHGIEGLVSLYGIESPGLTAALAIADEVAARLGVAAGPGGRATDLG
jgi:L-2-hydroxyglutarate oxidase LhgO